MWAFRRILLLFWPMLLSCISFLGSDAFVMQGKFRSSALAYSTSSDPKTTHGFDAGGRVNVEVCRTISFAPGSFQEDNEDPLVEASAFVREAWMDYHWGKGGGLPIVILEKENKNDDNDDVDESSSSTKNANGQKRVIAPVLMEETISSFPLQAELHDSKASLDLEYKVTSPGPFFGPDLVEGSHIGRVAFSSSYDETSSAIATTLVWSVEFDAIRLLDVYQKVTEFTIGTAATTVQEAASTPRLLTISTRLPILSGQDVPAKIARQEWLDFLFSTSGGGLPIPPPIPFGDILPEGGGIARKKLFRVPGIVETAMVEGPSNVDDGTATAYYRLENPGWFTFPFLFHTHLGRVRFSRTSQEEDKEQTESTVDMTWEIEIRPYAFAAPLVEKLVEIVVTTITRNIRTKLEAPEALVEIVPEISVPRATWIGRVLEARSKDTRSTWDQSVSLLQPWTWGDSGNGRQGEDEVLFEWSDGRLE